MAATGQGTRHEEFLAKYSSVEDRIRIGLESLKKRLPPEALPGFLLRLEGHCGELREELRRFSESVNDLQARESILRVGVIGQVKAGKSSFINALLFDGQEILPKAATPMTAALTVVKHGDRYGEFGAEIEFYSREDWQLIDEEARKYAAALMAMERSQGQDVRGAGLKGALDSLLGREGQEAQRVRMERERARIVLNDPAKKASYELVETARANNVGPDVCGEEVRSLSASSLEELNRELLQYVGAEGKFTPMVKSSTLYLSIDQMKGFELVDTPGMNDPVVSRGERTLAYLSRCDALFMLSYTGQFLDQADLSLFSRTIPSQGIKHLVLVGSKLDTVFLQDKKAAESGDIRAAAQQVVGKLNDTARNVLGSAARDNPALRSILDSALPPKFISTILHDAALKMERGMPLTDNERNILDRLRKMFPQSTPLFSSSQTLRSIAGVDRLGTMEFERLRAGKQEILKDRYVGMAESKEPELKGKVLMMCESLEAELNILDGDPDALLKRLGQLKARHDQLTAEVRVIFAEKAREVDKTVRGLQRTWSGMSRKADVTAQTKQESYTVSTSTWWNPFSWGGSETRYKDVRFVQPARIISDLKDSIERFCNDATDEISDLFSEEALRLLGKKIMAKILPVISEEEDLVDVSPYLSTIFLIVCDTVTMPRIKIDISKTRSKIIGRFKSETTDIEQFSAAFSELKDECADMISEQLEVQMESFRTILDKRATEFMARVTAGITDQLKMLARSVEERKELDQACRELHKIIKACSQA